MYHHYVLKPAVWHQHELEFEWDIELGIVRGKDADKVHRLCNEAVDAGTIIRHPFPTSYEIKDPLKRLSEMAVVLSKYWMLSDDLLAAYPVQKSSELAVVTDENGNEQYLQILN